MAHRERTGSRPTRTKNNPGQDPGKKVGEPIPGQKLIVAHRSIRGYQDGLTSAPEQGTIPTGFGAVIRNVPVNSETASQETTFVVQLGRIRAGTEPEALSAEDLTLGFRQADRFEVLEGEHKGPVLVVPLSLDKKYFIYVVFQGSAKPNEDARVTLKLIDRKGRIPREATIPASLIMGEGGFDLDPANPNNHGKELDSQHAQLFYAFETGEGKFTSEQQGKLPRTRRALGTRPASKPSSTIRYDLSRNVEAGLEDKFLDLMDSYVKLAAALGTQSSVAKLQAMADQELTVYANTTDAKAKRRMEEILREQLDHLQTTGFEQTLEMLYRFKKDAGESEAEVYKFKEARRIKFASTKKSRKIEMLFALIAEKRSMAVANFADYRDAWLKLFPRGPRTIVYWRPKWEKAEASGDQIELAEISEELRDELGKKLVDIANDYLEEIYVLNIDTGMPADQAEQKLSSQETNFKSSPLATKIEKVRELQDRANAEEMVLSFPLNLKLAGSLMGDDKDKTMAQLNIDFNYAPFDGKVRISRDLYQRFKTELDAAIEDYAMQVHLTRKERGLVKVAEYWNLSQIKARLRSLPRAEQLRILTSGEII